MVCVKVFISWVVMETTVNSLSLLHSQVYRHPGHLGAAAKCSKTSFFKSLSNTHQMYRRGLLSLKTYKKKKTFRASKKLVELSWSPHVSSFPCRCTDFLPHLKDWLIAIVKKWLFVSVCQPCDELVTHYQLESAPAGPTRDELKLRPTKLSTCIYDGLTLLRINITYTSHSSKTQGLLVKTQQTFPVI